MATPRALKDPNATPRKQEDHMAMPRTTTTKKEPFQAAESMARPRVREYPKATPTVQYHIKYKK